MPLIADAVDATAIAALRGLSSNPKTLPPWLFYDESGSQLFEEITTLPEYYLTRTEHGLLAAYADEILRRAAPATLVELGAGSAAKTRLLLRAAVEIQHSVLYQPIDVSPSALAEARATIEREIPGVSVRPQVANYVTEPIRIDRQPGTRVLALYIGSSIGNFSPDEAISILAGLRRRLEPGDLLLLGTDLAPSGSKSVASLLAAYDDASGVTASFNLNILTRLNRELDADFDTDRFRHVARWNAARSRVEMHLESTCAQAVRIPATAAGPAVMLRFQPGETIHTENSYKFTSASIASLLTSAGFATTRTFLDRDSVYALTLASAI